MKTCALFLFVSLVSPNLWAHGNIELIECYDPSNKHIFRGEPEGAKNKYRFSYFRDRKKIWSQKGIEVRLEDSAKEGKVIENIHFSVAKSGKGHLQVPEIYAREIRNGRGQLDFPGLGLKGSYSCSVVY